MSLILNIETATNVCSVALSQDGKLLALKESSSKNAHSAILTTFIEEITRESGFTLSDLDAISVSMGPGSYTGLRIGVATTKGLCYALNKPMIAIPTLQAMAAGIHSEYMNRHPEPSIRHLICPMIDARRMEVYCALYTKDLEEIRGVRAEIIEEHSFADFLATNAVIFAGEGSPKCREVLQHDINAIFYDSFEASAKHMISLSEKKFHNNDFENLAYFEPFYLKDFIAGKPRVKGLV